MYNPYSETFGGISGRYGVSGNRTAKQMYNYSKLMELRKKKEVFNKIKNISFSSLPKSNIVKSVYVAPIVNLEDKYKSIDKIENETIKSLENTIKEILISKVNYEQKCKSELENEKLKCSESLKLMEKRLNNSFEEKMKICDDYISNCINDKNIIINEIREFYNDLPPSIKTKIAKRLSIIESLLQTYTQRLEG